MSALLVTVSLPCYETICEFFVVFCSCFMKLDQATLPASFSRSLRFVWLFALPIELLVLSFLEKPCEFL